MLNLAVNVIPGIWSLNGLSVVVLFRKEIERLFIRLFNLRWSSSLPGRFTAGDIGSGNHSPIRWGPELMWALWSREKSLAFAGNRTRWIRSFRVHNLVAIPTVLSCASFYAFILCALVIYSLRAVSF